MRMQLPSLPTLQGKCLFSPVGDRPQRRPSVEGQQEDDVGRGPEDEKEAEDGDGGDHDDVLLGLAADGLGNFGGLHHQLGIKSLVDFEDSKSFSKHCLLAIFFALLFFSGCRKCRIPATTDFHLRLKLDGDCFEALFCQTFSSLSITRYAHTHTLKHSHSHSHSNTRMHTHKNMHTHTRTISKSAHH